MGGEAWRAPSGGLRSCACSRTGWGRHHHHYGDDNNYDDDDDDDNEDYDNDDYDDDKYGDNDDDDDDNDNNDGDDNDVDNDANYDDYDDNDDDDNDYILHYGAKDAACTWSLCSIRSGSTNCIDFPCPLESGPSSRFLGQPATGTRRVAGTTHTESGRR